MSRFIGIEAGGTKFVCAVGNAEGKFINREIFSTETPEVTLRHVIDYIYRNNQDEQIHAIGIGCFGPIELNKFSRYYGYITTSPKPGWQYINVVGQIKSAFDLPIGFDTDVNAAAIGEYRFGSLDNICNFIYVTVGTGIGSGAIVNGNLLYGLSHPEMGHMLIPQDKLRDPFSGVCPYHQNCLEGLASGTAIMRRWSVDSVSDLPIEHEAWDLEAYYLSLACANYSLTLSPQKIILGGGVMKQKNLFAKIHKQLPIFLNGYIRHPSINDYIITPTLGEDSGIIGAIALAEKSYSQMKNEDISTNIHNINKIYKNPWDLISDTLT